MGLFDNLDPVAGLDAASEQGIFGDIEVEGEISKGLKRGAYRLGSNVARTAEAVAGKAGFGALKAKSAATAERLNVAAQEVPPAVGSFRDVSSIGSAADYASGLISENIVQLPITALTAYLGARTGARALGDTALARMAGGAAGAFTPSYVQNFGEIYNEQREAGFDDPALAAKYALPTAALDVIGPGLLASVLLRPNKKVAQAGIKAYLDNILTGVVAGAAEEAPTEGLQELLGVKARAAVDPSFDPNSPDVRERIIEAIVGGATVGGALGGAGGAVNAALSTEQAPEQVPAEQPVSTEQAPAQSQVQEPAAPVVPEIVTPVDEVPLPEVTLPEDVLPLIFSNTPDVLEEAFIAAKMQAADDAFNADPEGITGKFLEKVASQGEARLAELDRELKLPAKARTRPKQEVVREQKQLMAQLEPMRQRAAALQALSATPTYQEKSPLVEGTLLDVQQKESPSATEEGIVTEGSLAEYLRRDAQRQATEASRGNSIEQSGQEQVQGRSQVSFEEQVASIKKEKGLLLSSQQVKALSKQQAETAAAALPIEIPTTLRARERLQFASTEVRAEAFINESGRIIDTNVNTLVESGLIREKAAPTVKKIINDGIRTSLNEKDTVAARAKIEGSIYKALKGKIVKKDAEAIVDNIMNEIAAQPNRFVPPASGGKLKSELREGLAGLPERATQAPLIDLPEPTPETAVTFVHYGNVPGGVTDPNMIGKGVRGAADQRDAIENGLAYTSAVLTDAPYSEPAVQQQPKYTGTLSASKIREARSDDPLMVEAAQVVRDRGIFNDRLVNVEYAKKVRDAGFDALMYPNGQLLIFTPQKVSPAFTLAQAKKKAPAIVKQHNEIGGGSWNLVTGQEMGGTANYAVSPYKKREGVIPGRPTTAQIEQYIEANEDLLSDPRNVLGTWFNEQDGNTYLDVSVITPSYDEAQRIAKKAKQIAFFNLRTFEEIKTETPQPEQPELFRNAQSFIALDRAHRYKGQAALEYLESILGTPSRLDVRPFTQTDPNGHTGVYRPGHLKDVIELAMNSKDVLSVAAHEGFHFLEQRELSAAERSIIRRAFEKNTGLFKRLEARTQAYDQENGTDITNEINMIPAEAHAYGFEYWRRGELQVDGMLRKVFQKIADLLTRIANFIDGLGFRTAEDIFTAIDRGEYSRRQNQAMRIEETEGDSWFDDIEPDAIPGLERAGDKSTGAPASQAKGRPYWVKTGADVARMRKRLKALALEGESSRDWHRASGEKMLELYNGDKAQAEILAKLVAVFSPRTPVGTDIQFAFKAINQFRNGEPIHAGVFPTEMSRKATLILTGKEDEKLVTGIKRNTFYRNLMNAIDPVEHSAETQGATIDMWMAHAFGFNNNLAGAINQSQYRYAEAEVGRLARELGWTIEETQAAIWVSTKARYNQVRKEVKNWGISKGMFESTKKKGDQQAGLFDATGGRAQQLKKDRETQRAYLEKWTELALSVPLDYTYYEDASYNYSHAIDELLAQGRVKPHKIEQGDVGELGVEDQGEMQLPEDASQASLRFYSKAALADMITEAKRGEAQLTQMQSIVGKIIDRSEIPDTVQRAVLGDTIKGYTRGATSSFKTFIDEYISSGMKLARKSAGYKNVFDILTSYNQRKDRLIVDTIDGELSEWRKGASSKNLENVTKALLDRTVNGYALNSPEMHNIVQKLDTKEREMFKQATRMIAGRLRAEFEADKRSFARLLGADSEQYAEWEGNRAIQVEQLINEGYFPERRYGDHAVHTYIEVNGKKLTLSYEQFEARGEAERRLASITEVLKDFPDIKNEYAFKYKAEFDGSVSFQQFIDMARRNGVELTQAERERLAKSMIASDSVRRNRIFRRKNVPGFSEDGERILAEFGVTMANKIAYSEFGSAIQDALKGTKVQSKFGIDGRPEINTYENTNEWKADGELSGFYRNLADRTTDFVTSPNPINKLSSTLRGAATLQFLGGSLAAGAVQLSSLGMNTAPVLSAYTGYTNALAKTMSALKVAATNHRAITDINTLQNTSIAIPDIDNVPGLRAALTIAVQDGTVLDTEIYQIMGLTRARTLSMSRGVRKAAEVWMAPFRITEQWNRISSFIAAYKIGKENGLTGDKLQEFARDIVGRTQGRYDEANRPALARGPVGALLFTFKAYPLFILETLTHLARENPKAAVVMLLSLTAMAGVEGLPFAEDIEDIVDTIAQRVFKSNFNSKRAMRNLFKTASETITGVDLSGVMMHGFANQMTGLNFAGRVGLGNLIPGTRIGAADSDYKKVMTEVLGPGGTVATGWLGAVDSLSRGEFVEAMRTGGPLAAQNLIKGVQSFQDGYALDKGGRRLVPASSWESFWQITGFSSSALSNAYEVDRIDKAVSSFYKEAQRSITNDIVRGVRSENKAQIDDAFEFLTKWNQSNPDMPIAINGPSIRRTIALNGLPLNQRTLLLLPKALRGSSESMAALYGTDR